MAEPFKNTPPAPEDKGEMTAQNIAAALAGAAGPAGAVVVSDADAGGKPADGGLTEEEVEAELEETEIELEVDIAEGGSTQI